MYDYCTVFDYTTKKILGPKCTGREEVLIVLLLGYGLQLGLNVSTPIEVYIILEV